MTALIAAGVITFFVKRSLSGENSAHRPRLSVPALLGCKVKNINGYGMRNDEFTLHCLCRRTRTPLFFVFVYHRHESIRAFFLSGCDYVRIVQKIAASRFCSENGIATKTPP